VKYQPKVWWLNFKGLFRETRRGRLRRSGLIRFGHCFLTKNELLRMVEWEVVQAKFQNVKL
jgi:hypothetical protein